VSEHVAAKTLVLDLTVEADRRLGHVIHLLGDLLGKRQPRQELRAGWAARGRSTPHDRQPKGQCRVGARQPCGTTSLSVP
jgi:hypothetical protein